MQPTSRGNPRGTKKKTCGTRRTRRTRGSHPQAHPEATRKSPRTHSTNVQRAPVHLPCAGVPSPAPSSACLAATRTVAVVVAEVLAALAGLVGVVALLGSPAVAVAAALLAVEDTWVAADTRGAGTCTGRIHTGGSRSSKAFPDPSSSAGTRTAAHTCIAPHTDTHAAADTHTPPSLSAERAERAKQVRHGKAKLQAVTESNVQTA